MTEDEAKTKACFKAATFGGSQQLADGPGPNCIGSACMAWRVAVKPAHQENAYNTPEPPPGDDWQPSSPSPKNMAWWRVIPEQHIGHCGLAGPVQ